MYPCLSPGVWLCVSFVVCSYVLRWQFHRCNGFTITGSIFFVCGFLSGGPSFLMWLGEVANLFFLCCWKRGVALGGPERVYLNLPFMASKF